MQFCHLHVHSSFTFGEGASTIDELIERARELGMPALALTDKDGLYGAVRFYQKAKKEGIKPIIGVEVTTESGHSLVLLAKNKRGYSNLCQLITRMHLSSLNSPILKLNTLREYSGDLFALSGGPKGEICFNLATGKRNLAEKAARRYMEIFGRENFIIELQDHLLPEEEECNQALFDLACRLHLLVCATNNIYYATPIQHELHQVLVKSAKVVHHREITEKPNDEYYLKSYSQMVSMFTKYPFTLLNTNLLAEECNLELPLGEIQTPTLFSSNRNNPHSHLLKLCFENLPQSYHSPSKEVVRRLIRELKTIKEKGFSSYFLLVADIVEFARKSGIRCSVTGSAPGSLVTYLTGISQIDPLKNDLLFERFLNPERRDFPDIDLDFDSRKRDQVIDYVFKKYRKEKVGLVATIPTFRARGAVREAGRALGLKYAEIDKLIQFLPYFPAHKINEALQALPELRESKLMDYRELIDISEAMNGLPRNVSVHLGGVVIAKEKLDSLVPLQKSLKGYPVCQYDKDDLETLGFIKLDLLSLRMLGAIEEAGENIKKGGISFDLDKTTFDDEKVYQFLRSTKTVGCFQLESPGMRQLLGKLQPRDFKDIIANISLFRPGPMQADMIRPFLARRWGKEKISYLHPSLESILKETYGVIIFQEQVLRIAQELAGFTLGQADLLRRSMKKKISEEEKGKLKEDFLQGCKEREVKKEIAKKVFEQISAFGAFGFCRAHATAFAGIAYQSAYLKLYYPKEFFLGVLNIEMMGPIQFQCILKEREKGDFSSFDDFCRRVKINKRLLENLIGVGCFDSLSGGKDDAQDKTFSLGERIAREMSILGFSFSGHALTLFKITLQEKVRVKSSQLVKHSENEKVWVAGRKIILHTPPTKSGTRVIFLTLEDEEGLIDAVVFPSVQEEFAKTIYEADFLLIEGYLQKYGPVISIVTKVAYDLREMRPT